MLRITQQAELGVTVAPNAKKPRRNEVLWSAAYKAKSWKRGLALYVSNVPRAPRRTSDPAISCLNLGALLRECLLSPKAMVWTPPPLIGIQVPDW